MKVEEFVSLIIKLKPTQSEVKKYSGETLNILLKEFEIKKKSNNEYENPILTLIKSYNVNSLRINDITFDNDYFDDGEHFCFGWDASGDRIAIYKPSGTIVAYDVYGERITFKCAENSEKFLDALVEIMKFSKEKMLNDYDEERLEKRSAEVACIAALKAGGEEYEDYYKSVLWVE